MFRPGKKGTSTTRSSSPSASRNSASGRHLPAQNQQPPSVCFDRLELNQILTVYGRKVAKGDWRDYAMDFGMDRAVFSVFRKACECPIYRIEKSPRLARKQGAYAVVSAHGLILKRGNDLRRVLDVLDKTLKLVEH